MLKFDLVVDIYF